MKLELISLQPQPQELIPIHPIYNVQDWDAAEGAIDWDRLSSALEHVKATGSLPREHKSHDHLNEQKDVPVEEEIMKTWVETFQKLRERWEEKEGKGIKLMWVLVDGFLLYWDKVCSSILFLIGTLTEAYAQRVRNLLDVRFFLRVPYDTLKARRHERHGYHTAGK
jgi:nicotinamide/nicotinate riboside kinase